MIQMNLSMKRKKDNTQKQISKVEKKKENRKITYRKEMYLWREWNKCFYKREIMTEVT